MSTCKVLGRWIIASSEIEPFENKFRRSSAIGRCAIPEFVKRVLLRMFKVFKPLGSRGIAVSKRLQPDKSSTSKSGGSDSMHCSVSVELAKFKKVRPLGKCGMILSLT